MLLHEQMNLNLNNVEQYVNIRSRKEDAPLLIYLHGGPGDAALPLVLKYNSELEKYFTLVIWEQRGAGKSYYKFSKEEHITIDTFVEDMHQLILILSERFKQEKVFLVGHSWGSVLGLRYIQKYPQNVRAYIGCGQVANMIKSCRIAYEYAMEHADRKTKCRLRQIDPSYKGDNWMQDLLFVTKQVVKYKGSLFGKHNHNSLVLPFLFSGEYSIADLINRQRGSVQSIAFLWQELMTVDFEPVINYDVPIIFAEGRHDYHVSSSLAYSYFRKIQSAKRFVWFEHSCHFPQWSENKKFNKLMVEIIANCP